MDEKDQGTLSTAGTVGGDATAVTNPPTLTIQDLGNIRSIIDAASQRGAFRAAEMVSVGTVYNKLNDFLNAASQASQANEPEKAV